MVSKSCFLLNLKHEDNLRVRREIELPRVISYVPRVSGVFNVADTDCQSITVVVAEPAIILGPGEFG